MLGNPSWDRGNKGRKGIQGKVSSILSMHLSFLYFLNEHLNFASINTFVSNDASLDIHTLGNSTDFIHSSAGLTRVRGLRATLVLEHQLIVQVTQWTKTLRLGKTKD